MFGNKTKTIVEDPEYAFPNPEYSEMNGMLLRDYFAIRILTGWLSNSNVNLKLGYEQLCKDAYGVANQMMAERNK